MDGLDTSRGGEGRTFPSTRWSVVRETQDPRSPRYREAIDQLCRLYWKPVYAYFRSVRPVTREEAKDQTQDFFLHVMEGTMLQHFSPDLGSFRSYLRGALRYFLLNRHEKDTALKRGGGQATMRLDAAPGVLDALTSGSTPEEAFDRAWAKSVVDHALDDLRSELTSAGKDVYYQVFDRYELAGGDGDAPSYGEVARELAIKETDVTNYLFACRKRLKALIHDRILDYVHDPGDVPAELARVFALLSGTGE